MEQRPDRGGKSLNPFDVDVDSELLELSIVVNGKENGVPSPVQQLEQWWGEIDSLLCSQTMDPFALDELRELLSKLEKALIKDRPESDGQTGPCLQYLLNENIVENIYQFSTRQKVYSKEIRILLLKFFTEVFTRSPQPILIHQQILRPISKLLRACEGTKDHEMSSSLVPLLHTMCILMQENQSLLDLFFIESHVHMQSRFLVFTQLIPHIHENGEVGNRARDAILLCLSLADQLPGSSLTYFIASDSNFCQVLATGLSGLYCGLPSTRDLVVDEWQSPLPVIEKAVPELRMFIQALDFCNSVLQMAPKEVCNTMLTLVREGFLQQVMGAALLQRSESAVMFALAYTTIFLTHITNVMLMREFLRYLMQGRHDNRSVLDALIQHISSSNHLLCAVTLEFFYVLLDLNCEDVMLELILKYLLPGLHVMPNQLAIIGTPDLYAQAARKFLQLLPASCIEAEKMFLDSVRKSQTPPPTPPTQPSEGRMSLSPPPPFLTSSPMLSGRHLERPIPFLATPSSSSSTPSSKAPLTNLPVLPLPPPLQATPTNPFDIPLPAHTPISRSRSGSDASTSSLVSMSSTSSAPQGGAANSVHDNRRHKTHTHTALTSSSSSSADSLHFKLISPEMAYFNYLTTVREAIKECVNRCHCWSSIYDKCQVSKEMLLKNRKEAKALEMEDIPSIKIRINMNEDDSAGANEDSQQGAFRSRVTTLASKSRLSRTSNLRNHDRLHSRRANPVTGEENETKMVAGTRTSAENANSQANNDLPASRGLRRSGTVSGGSQPQRSPRFSRKYTSSSSQFEDIVGLFLKIMMDKLMEMMQHPPSVNILLTRLIGRLTHYPQPLLRSLLLNHQLVLQPGVPNLFNVLQFLKQTVDRYAKTQEGFEKRLGRARKTMIYRAQVRNSQVKESVARQIMLRQLHQNTSRTDLESSLTTPSSTPDGAKPTLTKKAMLVPTSSSGKEGSGNGGKMAASENGMVRRQGHRSIKRSKKVSTDTLFAVIIFHEFIQELASISEEQSVIHSLLYLPKSTSLLVY